MHSLRHLSEPQPDCNTRAVCPHLSGSMQQTATYRTVRETRAITATSAILIVGYWRAIG
jgi:hypothetical protein